MKVVYTKKKKNDFTFYSSHNIDTIDTPRNKKILRAATELNKYKI